MSAQYNDGTVQYGSRSVVVKKADGTTTRATYVFDNITIRRPTKKILRTQQLGEPSGSVGVADFVEGSGQYQLATATTTIKNAASGQFNVMLDKPYAMRDVDRRTGIGSTRFDIAIVGRFFHLNSISWLLPKCLQGRRSGPKRQTLQLPCRFFN